MGTSVFSKPETIWLKWDHKLGLLGTRDSIVFAPVTHRDLARGEDKEYLERLLKEYEPDLIRSEPSYIWSIEADDARLLWKYIIRGDLKK
jgi:hypothetical protein